MTRQKNAGTQAGKTSDFEAINCDYAANTTEHQAKPKIGLLSWSKFGGEEGTKPSRNRQPKQSWQRQQPKPKAYNGNLSAATRMPIPAAINAPILITSRCSSASNRWSKSSFVTSCDNASLDASTITSACSSLKPVARSRLTKVCESKSMVAIGRSLSRLPPNEHRQGPFSPMTEPTKQNVQAGAGLDAQIETVSARNFGDSKINVVEIAINKPEVDLLRWSALGRTAKQVEATP